MKREEKGRRGKVKKKTRRCLFGNRVK